MLNGVLLLGLIYDVFPHELYWKLWIALLFVFPILAPILAAIAGIVVFRWSSKVLCMVIAAVILTSGFNWWIVGFHV